MTFLRSFLIAGLTAVVGVGSAHAAPTILSTAAPTINLSMAGLPDQSNYISGYPMAVAYHPGFNQYYGGGGGYPGASGVVWDAAGNTLQVQTPINVDIRGVTYNSNTNAIETIGYCTNSGCDTADGYAGLRQMGLDGSGLYTGVNTLLLGQMPGLISDQTVPAYDSDADTFYSRSGSDTVHEVRHSDGSLVRTLNLDTAAAGTAGFNLQQYTIGFDSFFDVFVTLDLPTSRALVFDVNGSYIGASQLPTMNYDYSYQLSYTNGQLFVGEYGSNYYGFQIFADEQAAPAPGALALLALGLAGLPGLRRRRFKR